MVSVSLISHAWCEADDRGKRWRKRNGDRREKRFSWYPGGLGWLHVVRYLITCMWPRIGWIE